MQNSSDGTPYAVRGGPYAQCLAQLIQLHPCHLTGQPVLPTLGIDADITCSMPGLLSVCSNFLDTMHSSSCNLHYQLLCTNILQV